MVHVSVPRIDNTGSGSVPLMLSLPHALVRILCIPSYIAGHSWQGIYNYCAVSRLPYHQIASVYPPNRHDSRLPRSPPRVCERLDLVSFTVRPCQQPHPSVPQPLNYTPDHPEITADTASGSQAGRQVGRQAGITSDNDHHDFIHFSHFNHSASALLCLPACRISLRVFPLSSFFLFLFLPVSPSLPTCFHSRCCLLFVQLPLPPIFSHFLSILSSQILYPPFHSSFIHLFILHHSFIHLPN